MAAYFQTPPPSDDEMEQIMQDMPVMGYYKNDNHGYGKDNYGFGFAPRRVNSVDLMEFYSYKSPIEIADMKMARLAAEASAMHNNGAARCNVYLRRSTSSPAMLNFQNCQLASSVAAMTTKRSSGASAMAGSAKKGKSAASSRGKSNSKAAWEMSLGFPAAVAKLTCGGGDAAQRVGDCFWKILDKTASSNGSHNDTYSSAWKKALDNDTMAMIKQVSGFCSPMIPRKTPAGRTVDGNGSFCIESPVKGFTNSSMMYLCNQHQESSQYLNTSGFFSSPESSTATDGCLNTSGNAIVGYKAEAGKLVQKIRYRRPDSYIMWCEMDEKETYLEPSSVKDGYMSPEPIFNKSTDGVNGSDFERLLASIPNVEHILEVADDSFRKRILHPSDLSTKETTDKNVEKVDQVGGGDGNIKSSSDTTAPF